jgi:mannitol 2-dehydrogenase
VTHPLDPIPDRPLLNRSAAGAGRRFDDPTLPTIVHIGVGTFHRTHQAYLLGELRRLAPDDPPWRLVGIGLLEADGALAEVMGAQEGVYSVVERSPDGTRVSLVSTISSFIHAPRHPEAAQARLADPTTAIVSLTVTEGGYTLSPAELRAEANDEDGPGAAPRTWPGYLVDALDRRRAAGTPPFTVLSCDNLPGNGQRARDLVLAVAAGRDPALAEWIAAYGRFPSTMVDRISPATTEEVRELAWQATGYDDRWPVQCEPYLEWRIEDDFVAGVRPEWDRLDGVSFVEDVHPYEVVKLRLLNVAHQAIAYPGLLLGLRFAHEAVADGDIVGFVDRLMDHDVVPNIEPPAGVSVPTYRATVADRFANPYLADTLERLATDSINRLRQFAGPPVLDGATASTGHRQLALLVALWAITLTRADPDHLDTLCFDHADAIRAIGATSSNPRVLIGPEVSWCPIPGAPEAFWAEVAGWLDHLDDADESRLRRVLSLGE